MHEEGDYENDNETKRTRCLRAETGDTLERSKRLTKLTTTVVVPPKCLLTISNMNMP